ncbi:tyrosine-type recombinase/integrase [Roseivivax sp. THAF197b]|uniref:tyrosine-type recombinase/integrase n=1 Tax=Roseivivax sp. THAF197b TaxID=2588299 RepID=UPI001268C0E0|nr:tyrosine-type recombinase/integrase [Roseivivax sp. THAF197b]QFS83023.1 Phage integrase family protein [Roseivivax sp. THAF197b]
MNAHLTLLCAMRAAGPHSGVPQHDELQEHLQDRFSEVGKSAWAEFAHVQRVASGIWGAEATAHFGQVLRAARVSVKTKRKTDWQLAEDAIERLPRPWRDALRGHGELSKRGERVKGARLWSAAHLRNVALALGRWANHCHASGLPQTPTGASLDAYSRAVANRTTARTAADYAARILSGFSIIAPGFSSEACDFVAQDWKERAAEEGCSTKTGSQLVGARRIYDLGFELIDSARERPVRGPQAAKEFRNGILLALATALPQRARAMSALASGTTLQLIGDHTVRIWLPARLLKLPEDQKNGEPFERLLTSQKLYAAVEEYLEKFRPIFDDGTFLFPSSLNRGEAVTEKHLGRLAGDLTARAFGVRVSLHRLRDNVATEVSEHLSAGGRKAAYLLGHKDERTTRRHYDHSQGIAVAQEFIDLLEERRADVPDLALRMR